MVPEDADEAPEARPPLLGDVAALCGYLNAAGADEASGACEKLVLPVILSRMKTAISLPDALSEQIDACARELKMTRSGLLAQAAREFVARRRRPPDPTEAWNQAIEKAGQPGDDPAARAFRRRAKEIVGSSNRRPG